MCGIFGYIGTKDTGPSLVLAGLKHLEYRGYDSWGIAAIPLNKNSRPGVLRNPGKQQRARDTRTVIIVKKEIGKIGSATVSDMPKSSFALGHTRWATHGGVTKINAHPHLDCSQKIAIIHNGIIENYSELKEYLVKKGHIFVSETDSEVASHLIEELLKSNSFDEAVRKAFKKFEGLNAIIAITSSENYFVAVRNGSPLVAGFSKNGQFLASDPSALSAHTTSAYFLKDNEMLILGKNSAVLKKVSNGEMAPLHTVTLASDNYSAEKGKYDHFMLKEIYEEPDVLLSIARSGKSQATKLAGVIKKSYGSYLVGCGTAAHACIAGTYLFSKIAKRHINFAIGSEFSYHLDFLTNKSLVVALSQSGETMDTLVAVKNAKEKGAKIAALVNVFGSTLYRDADIRLLIGAGTEKGVASTKAFIGKLAYLILTAHIVAGKTAEGIQKLELAAQSSRKLLQQASIDSIKNLAKKLKNSADIYIIGRGLSYPTSLEAALKIKEISYIHAEGLAAGELKHGPLALVEKGTPSIVFAPSDETYAANIAAAMEMKARGGFIVGISYRPHPVFETYIPVGDAKEATIIPNVIVSQLLAYYLAILKGLDPDKPRNLAKSVTVK